MMKNVHVGLEGDPLLRCVDQVSDDALDGGPVGLLGSVMAESGDLVDCELDVRTGVGRYIQEHTDCCRIVPFFLEDLSTLV